jgi:TolA-binding protein
MECQELHRDEVAEKYLNERLDPSARDEFEVHILACAQCLQRVEAVQTLRQELAERAHQIRAYSEVERFRFRWRWVTVAAFSLVVCGLGVVELRKMKAPQSAKTQVQAPASAPSATGPNGVAPATSSSQASSARADNLPVNGRNYVNFSLKDSQGTRDTAPSTGSAPSSGLNFKGHPARSNLVHLDGVDNSITGTSDSIEYPATSRLAPPPAPEKLPAPEVSSDETAKELFRLGTVQAPPYTFSGFSSWKDTSVGGDPSALSGKSGAPHSSDSTRPYFRNAMNAYLEKRYMDALELLEKAVKAEPDAPDVNFYLGICRLLEAKPGDSIASFNAVLQNPESPLTQAAHFYLAKALVQIGSLAQAEAQLQLAATMPGSLSTEASMELARLRALLQEGKPKNTEGPNP